MKVVNLMNFVRRFDPRLQNSEELLFNSAHRRMEMLERFGVDNTLLLQYDALIDPRYIELFGGYRDQKYEYGLWFEIVQPLCEEAGIAWRGRLAWDWNVMPGFSMSYTPSQREKLLDTAMARFREIFGYYPKTVAS